MGGFESIANGVGYIKIRNTVDFTRKRLCELVPKADTTRIIITEQVPEQVPPEQTPPEQTPPDQVHPQSRPPWDQVHPPEQTPQSRHPRSRHLRDQTSAQPPQSRHPLGQTPPQSRHPDGTRYPNGAQDARRYGQRAGDKHLTGM